MDGLGSGFRLIRQDQEALDLGFDASSINNREISGLVAGSRAAQAGLEDGDEILKNSFVWEVGNDIGRNMDMTVRRPDGKAGRLIEISYWPRSWEKVESYKFVEIEK